MLRWIFLPLHLRKRAGKEAAGVQEAFRFPSSLLHTIHRCSFQFPFSFFQELAFLSGATGSAVQGHPWKLSLAKPCISKGIRQEKEAFAICKFNPTEKYFLPDIQTDQIDRPTVLETEARGSFHFAPTDQEAGDCWRGGAGPCTACRLSLGSTTLQIRLSSPPGKVAYATLSQGHAAAAHVSLDALAPSAA